MKLHHKFTKQSKIQKSPYYRGLELWDKLPPVMHVKPSCYMNIKMVPVSAMYTMLRYAD